MTNTAEIMDLLTDLGYAHDPGFSGAMTRYNGSTVLVVFDDFDGVELQLFWIDSLEGRDGDPRWDEIELEDPVMVWREVPPGPISLVERVRSLDLVVDMDTAHVLL